MFSMHTPHGVDEQVVPPEPGPLSKLAGPPNHEELQGDADEKTAKQVDGSFHPGISEKLDHHSSQQWGCDPQVLGCG